MRFVQVVGTSFQEFMEELRPLRLTRRARAVFAALALLAGLLAFLAVLADVGLALFDVVTGAEQDTEAAAQMVIGPIAIIVAAALVLAAVLALVAAVDGVLRGIRWSVERISA